MTEDSDTNSRPGEESIILTEHFIDSYMEKVKYDALKKYLYEDILNDVLAQVRQELSNLNCVNSERLLNRKTKLDDKNIFIEHLKTEISFLREEIAVKNSQINYLTKESLLHDDENSSHNFQQIISQNFESKIEVSNPQLQQQLNNHDNSKECDMKIKLNDQLMAVRIKKHEKFQQHKTITVNNKRENVTNKNDEKKKSVKKGGK